MKLVISDFSPLLVFLIQYNGMTTVYENYLYMIPLSVTYFFISVLCSQYSFYTVDRNMLVSYSTITCMYLLLSYTYAIYIIMLVLSIGMIFITYKYYHDCPVKQPNLMEDNTDMFEGDSLLANKNFYDDDEMDQNNYY